MRRIIEFIRMLFGRCPLCGSKIYWWDSYQGYCTKCEYRIKLPPL